MARPKQQLGAMVDNVAHGRWWAAIWLTCCLGRLASPVTADEIELLDGRRLNANVRVITGDGQLRGESLTDPLPLSAVRKLTREATEPTRGVVAVIELAGDGRLVVREVTLADERLVVQSSSIPAATLALAAVRGLRFDVGAPAIPFAAALARPATDVDRFFVRGETIDTLESIDALVESIDAEQVTMELRGQPRRLARERLYGVVLAASGTPAKTLPAGWVVLYDGSRIPFDRLELADGQCTVSGFAELKLGFPWSGVAALDVRSPRLRFVSDLKPRTVEERHWVAPPRTWRRDASVGGRPLTLGSQAFAKGLGVKAGTRLVFDVPAGSEWFLATVGVDAETGGEGDCIMEVLDAEGRSLWRERVRGRDEPRMVRVRVAATRTLTLAVEPGEDLDLSDHADWADARLVLP